MRLKAIENALLHSQNVVLHGVPGSGKTYLAKKLVENWEESVGKPVGANASGKFSITFHPSTSYEDFVEGLRPRSASQNEGQESTVDISVLRNDSDSSNSVEIRSTESDHPLFVESPQSEGEDGFTIKDGFFIRACRRAVAEPQKHHFVLLDEFNRANTPKVLGDLLTTVEKSKRAKWDSDKEYWDLRDAIAVTLPYSGRIFFVPENIYIIATMNTSDESIAPLDTALRRRFSFVRIDPLKREGLVTEIEDDVSEAKRSSIEIWESLNDDVLRNCLGPHSALGHSYFFEGDQRLPEPREEKSKDLWETLRDNSTSHGSLQRACWFETGGTGGSGNQVDLSHTSAQDRNYGIVHALLGVSDDELSDTDKTINVYYEGSLYKNCEVKIYNDRDTSNGSWRLLFNGETSDGESLTPVARDNFANSLISLCQVDDNEYVIRAHSKSELDLFHEISDHYNLRGGGSDRLSRETNLARSWCRSYSLHRFSSRMVRVTT